MKNIENINKCNISFDINQFQKILSYDDEFNKELRWLVDEV